MLFDKAKGRKWEPGMDLPRGGKPRLRIKPDDLKKCPRDGEGTLDNPMVIWAARLTKKQRQELTVPEFEDEADLYRAIDANADIAKTVAIRSGCTVVWIICPVHTSKYVYENGERVPTKWDDAGNPTDYLVVEADPHMTLRLGTSEDVCLLHGHANVLVDERGFPTTFTTGFQRRCNERLTDGDHRVLELFEWTEESSTEEYFRQANADYELFKTLTMRDEGWEIDDLGNQDADYNPPDHIETILENDAKYVPVVNEEAEYISPAFEDYIVHNWSPYRRWPGEPRIEGSISTRNFGFNIRQSRYKSPNISRYFNRRPEVIWY
ncbi:uncharacterized protein F4817DRAFT_356723 [Daldinia loculata]|uniref:uncharacterized protein n=1 Tax=Daldinia loculata TaxID=103429 RepID=UPI0020C461AC|nr:uncharacterized protein F4817DRAFT_356723 [Daldinia loculata]KAI1650439.1 hypothetical protein F4817DRAFT_356723 [Daldinia loculata]